MQINDLPQGLQTDIKLFVDNKPSATLMSLHQNLIAM